MTAARRPVVITGIGLVSSLGEGLVPHLAALHGTASPVVDTESFAPYPVHPLAPIDISQQIPKRSDQRQMENWQRLGVYAAGLALASAGLHEDAAVKDRLELLVAAGGGERDHEVDGAIATGIRHADDKAAYLNEHLMNDLRPTLFLAQLSNLLAGNIAIVHGVTGGSRTFMGEEQAGVDALRVATERIASGQCDAIMVGGAYNAERRDMLLLLEFGGCLHKGAGVPVFADDRGGAVMGSLGAFVVLESADGAAARGAKVLAEIAAVASGWARREPGAVEAELGGLIGQLGPFEPGAHVISAASGVAPWTAEERSAIGAAVPQAKLTAVGDLVGHGLEAAFPAATALAAALIAEGEAAEVLVTGAGHWRGEGAARLVAAAQGGGT
jgi:3-oxoacyl-[acyl-carrier-protein] synthase II